MNWCKLRKEHGRWVTCNAKPQPAPKGVSISSERVKDEHDGQHTIERIAVDGVVKHELHCYNGQQRDQATKKAISYCK